VRFIALSLFLLHAKFYAYWYRHDKVTASDKVGRFYPRDAMLARVFAIATCLDVRLSVCPSVTRRYCA